MTLPILDFAKVFSASIAGVAVSTVRTAKAQVASEFNKAWVNRSAEIFRQRSLALTEFSDRRLQVGPNGAAWMTPEELAFFHQFNTFYWRVLTKAENQTTLEKKAPTLRRTAQAAATKAATAAAGRRRRTPPPASRRSKSGEE
ncbi:MAG: hypothetical protein R3C27_12360 [Hyphomonadaceae bacterium]